MITGRMGWRPGTALPVEPRFDRSVLTRQWHVSCFQVRNSRRRLATVAARDKPFFHKSSTNGLVPHAYAFTEIDARPVRRINTARHFDASVCARSCAERWCAKGIRADGDRSEKSCAERGRTDKHDGAGSETITQSPPARACVTRRFIRLHCKGFQCLAQLFLSDSCFALLLGNGNSVQVADPGPRCARHEFLIRAVSAGVVPHVHTSAFLPPRSSGVDSLLKRRNTSLSTT